MKISVLLTAFLVCSASAQTSSKSAKKDSQAPSSGSKGSKATKSSKTTLFPTPAPTVGPTTLSPTAVPTTAVPTTAVPTTLSPTAVPTTAVPTTLSPTAVPTTAVPTTLFPTAVPTTAVPTTLSPSRSPSTFPHVVTPVQGRCSWNKSDCRALESLVISTNNHPDVTHLHTEICQAFATLTPPQYPEDLHCPRQGHADVNGWPKLINIDQSELNAANNWTTCGGGVSITKGNPIYQFELKGVVLARNFPITIFDKTKCQTACVDDRLCKYSYYSSFTGSVDLGRCLIFHESDTLSPDTTWSRLCSFAPEQCVLPDASYKLWAKCDEWGNTGTFAPSNSPTTGSPTATGVTLNPTVDPRAKIPGRCAWTPSECQELGKAINAMNQHYDVANLHTELCQTFAKYFSHYPASLHCPSNGHNQVNGTIKRMDGTGQNELGSATNYTSCGGGIKIAKGNIFYEWMIHGIISYTKEMSVFTATTECPKVCEDDILCKYAVYTRSQTNEAIGYCSIFHESDTLTPGSYWTQYCSWKDEDSCFVDEFFPYVWAKCDDFNNPPSTDSPTTSPSNTPTSFVTPSPTPSFLNPQPGSCSWSEDDCIQLHTVIDHASQVSDVDILHTELCKAFASLGVFPSELHCPSSNVTAVTGSLKRVDNPEHGELTQATGYSTCGGGLKLERNSRGLMAWKLKAKLANSIYMDIYDAVDGCTKACNDDPLCKYAAWIHRLGVEIAAGDCLIFHESDTLSPSTYWEKECGWTEFSCLDYINSMYWAKCDNFNVPP